MSVNPVDFSDLEGDLDDTATPAYYADGRPGNDAAQRLAHGDFLAASAEFAAKTAPQSFRCTRCGGSGQTPWGACFKCGGSGRQARAGGFKSDPASIARRQKAAERREARRVQDFRDLQARIAAWKAEHAAAWAWIDVKSKADRVNEFADSLSAGLYKWGSLTDGQLAAIERIVAQNAERAAVLAAEQATPVNGLDLSNVPGGMYAVPDGETRLKVRIDKPTPPSKWAGYVFVSDGAEYGSQRKYGRQAPGRMYAGDIVEQLKAIAADPRGASAAYGHLVGRCGVCGRKLEDAGSIERGIGPVCADKAGW